MLGRFLPKETNFFDYFEKHISVTVQATQEFSLLVNPSANISDCTKKIKQLEHEADSIVHQCVEGLHKTFITPFERNDIYLLISHMDDIIDYINQTAEKILIYRLTAMTPEVQHFASILSKATLELEFIIKKLRKLDDVPAIREIFISIKNSENESDALLRKSIGELFDNEKNVLEIIKWKEIYENLEEAVNRCNHVSNIIEGVILELS